jgi:hypothetical protein
MAPFVDKRLPKSRMETIDTAIAKWVFETGQPFNVVALEQFKTIFASMNASFWFQSIISTWNLRNQHLEMHHEANQNSVSQALRSAAVLTAICDGWQGLQKRHMINVLVATPTPYFLANIYTNTDSPTGQYHFEQVSKILDSKEIKVTAIVTDNAAAMKKFWRLFRQANPGVITLGCAAHGLELLAKDLSSNDLMKNTLAECVSIVKWFSRHIQLGGLATLREYQKETMGHESALILPSLTRWNSRLACIQSLCKTKGALFETVTSKSWPSSGYDETRIKRLISDDRFWSHLNFATDILQPVKIAIMLAQADDSLLSDVYVSIMVVHAKLQKTDIDLQIVTKRAAFILHPCHLVATMLDHRYNRYVGIPPSQFSEAIPKVAAFIAQRRSDVLPVPMKEISSFLRSLREANDNSVLWSSETVKLLPLEWWENFRDLWPSLFRLATIVFNIPCSAAAAERVWSNSGHIISSTRTKLSPRRADKLLSIYFNSRSFQSRISSNTAVNLDCLKDGPSRPFPHDFANLHLLGSDVEDADGDDEQQEHDDESEAESEVAAEEEEPEDDDNSDLQVKAICNEMPYAGSIEDYHCDFLKKVFGNA